MDRQTLLLNDAINDKSNRTKAKKTGTNVSKTEKSRICSNTEMTDKWNLIVVIKWYTQVRLKPEMEVGINTQEHIKT